MHTLRFPSGSCESPLNVRQDVSFRFTIIAEMLTRASDFGNTPTSQNNSTIRS